MRTDYSKIYLFQSKSEIKDAEELEDKAAYINKKMQEYRSSGNTVHLFLDTLAPLAFLLGGKRTFPGEVKLYEYIAEREEYVASLNR